MSSVHIILLLCVSALAVESDVSVSVPVECTSDVCAVQVKSLLQHKHRSALAQFSTKQFPEDQVDCDWQTEETCFDDAWQPISCAPLSGGGCPCPDGYHKCGHTEKYAGWCQFANETCPLTCDWETEEACTDANWTVTSCASFAVGCPCKIGEHRCDEKDGYAGWCSSETCPVSCDWQTEETCHDENWIATSCAPLIPGCPCSDGWHKCDQTDMWGGWCSNETCPLTCDWRTEETCYDENGIATSCASFSDGCPCKVGEHRCGQKESYAGWCSSETCPVSCDWQIEETCYDENWVATSCAPLIPGCPCSDGWHKCGQTDTWGGWCSNETCPLTCDWQTEETCYDENWIATSCEPFLPGCPCPDRQQKCGATDSYAGWCSSDPCPLNCDWQTEETCYDEHWTATSCEPFIPGCPCPDGQQKCGATDSYAGWCSSDPCPLTCDWTTQMACHDENWTTISCAPYETGCDCPQGFYKCGQTDTYGGWCQDTECGRWSSLVDTSGRYKSQAQGGYRGKGKGKENSKGMGKGKGKSNDKGNAKSGFSSKGKGKSKSKSIVKGSSLITAKSKGKGKGKDKRHSTGYHP